MCTSFDFHLSNFFFSPLAGMFFSIFNSMANPIVYTILMPSYRRAMMSTISCTKEVECLEESSTNVASVSENTNPNQI